MSKSNHERRRYVALQLECEIQPGRGQLTRALEAYEPYLGAKVHLTRYAYPHLFVRIDREAYPKLRDACPLALTIDVKGESYPARATSLLSSGTIRSLVERLGVLEENPRRG